MTTTTAPPIRQTNQNETKCSKSNYLLPTCYPIITNEVLERPIPTTDEDTIGTRKMVAPR